jgi:hypothetical protein
VAGEPSEAQAATISGPLTKISSWLAASSAYARFRLSAPTSAGHTERRHAGRQPADEGPAERAEHSGRREQAPVGELRRQRIAWPMG